MAGDWIKMRLDLQTHPKIVRILSATKADKFRVVGGLHAVWSVFDTHSADGRLEGYTVDTLDHIIGWTGFSAAMASVGWLVADGEEALLLPEYDEHNGKSGKRRAEDQKRKREGRKSPQSVRNLSAIEPDELRTREEKRREEKKELKPSMSEQSPDAASDPEPTERRKREPSPDDLSLASRIFGLILDANPSAKKPNLTAWADDIRLMREQDKRTLPEIWSLFQWARKDSFWRPNVMSPAKLREKFDQLIEVRATRGAGSVPLNDKFHFADKDYSADVAAMNANAALRGITTIDDEMEHDL